MTNRLEVRSSKSNRKAPKAGHTSPNKLMPNSPLIKSDSGKMLASFKKRVVYYFTAAHGSKKKSIRRSRSPLPTSSANRRHVMSNSLSRDIHINLTIDESCTPPKNTSFDHNNDVDDTCNKALKPDAHALRLMRVDTASLDDTKQRDARLLRDQSTWDTFDDLSAGVQQ